MTRRACGQRVFFSLARQVWLAWCARGKKIEAQHAEIIIYCSKLRMVALVTVISPLSFRFFFLTLFKNLAVILQNFAELII